jgi:hypothetical protein
MAGETGSMSLYWLISLLALFFPEEKCSIIKMQVD